jgi:hypothetical protein
MEKILIKLGHDKLEHRLFIGKTHQNDVGSGDGLQCDRPSVNVAMMILFSKFLYLNLMRIFSIEP